MQLLPQHRAQRQMTLLLVLSCSWQLAFYVERLLNNQLYHFFIESKLMTWQFYFNTKKLFRNLRLRVIYKHPPPLSHQNTFEGPNCEAYMNTKAKIILIAMTIIDLMLKH